MAKQTATIALYAYISAAWVQLNEVIPAHGSWGISSNDPLDRLADIGEFRFALDNSTGLYSPDSGTALAGWKKGLPFKLVLTYDGTDYVRFRGVLTDIDIKPNKSEKRVYVTALDWLDYAAQYPITNPDLLEEATTDEAITELVSNMPIAPQATNYDVGLTAYPTVFDSVKNYTKGYTEFGKLALSEPGYIYLEKDALNGETLVFEAADYRNGLRSLSQIPKTVADSGFLKKEDNGYLLKEDSGKLVLGEVETVAIDNTMLDIEVEYGNSVINRVVTSAYPKRQDTTPVVLYDLERPLPFASGETKTFKGKYINQSGGNQINALAPEQDTYTKALLHGDGYSGSPIIADEAGKTWSQVSVEVITNVLRMGTGSLYFDGGSSYIYSEDSPDWDLGTDDFTIEWWEYRFNTTSGKCVTSRAHASSFPAFRLGISDGTNSDIYMSSDGATWDIANGETFGAITIAEWVHYAVVRSGANFYAFKDGVQTAAWTSSEALFASSSVMSVGRTGSVYLTACIDDFRFSKGIARYTADFTPHTTPHLITGTFGAMWTASNETGTDLTGDMTITVDYGTNGAEYTVYNGSSNSGYLTSLQTVGYGIYSYSSVEDTQLSQDSIDEYGYQNSDLQQAYQADTYIGRLEAAKIVNEEKQPRTKLNKVRLSANRSTTFMMAFLNIDVGDLVHITEDTVGIDAYYYIQGIDFELAGGGIINFTWTIKEAYTTAKGLTLMACEFAGGSATDAMDFNYLPLVSGDGMTKRIFSAWVYLDSVPTANDYIIMGAFSDNAGSYLAVKTHATNKYLKFYTNRWAAEGQWTCTTTQITLSTWTHVLVYQDLTSVVTDPSIYVGGTLQTLTEDATPSGALKSEVGVNLLIGNIKTPTYNYNRAFDGKLKDLRVYDATSLTPATVASGIAGEGAGGTGYTDGLIFQAFAVRTGDVTAYTSLTLTSEDKMLDTYLGYIGTANGSPISRTV